MSESTDMSKAFIEFCNFIDKPVGGQLTFAKNFLAEYKDDFDYIGYGCMGEPVGQWINNCGWRGTGNFFFIGRVWSGSGKRFLPERVIGIIKFIIFLSFLRKKKYHVIFVQSPEALLCAKLLKTDKIVYRFAGVANPVQFSRFVHLRFLANWFDCIFFQLLKYTHTIYVTADSKSLNEVVAKLDIVGGNACVKWIPTFVNGRLFRFSEKMPRDCPKFVMVGRLNKDKRYEVALQAFSKMVTTYKNATLEIVGDGEERKNLEKLVMELGIANSICFKGNQSSEKIVDILHKSNIFLLSSQREGWPTALVEAIATGRYAVATQVSGVEDILDSDDRGLIIAVNDVESFYKGMLNAWLRISSSDWYPKPDDRYLASNIRRYLSSI